MFSLAAIILALAPLALAARTTVTSNNPTMTFVTFPNTRIAVDSTATRNQFANVDGVRQCANRAANGVFEGFEYSSASAANGGGFTFNGVTYNCYIFMFTAACQRQSQISRMQNTLTGMVDRCSEPNAPAGYSMAADGTCIFTANFPPTAADYSGACMNNMVRPLPSNPAYKKRGGMPLVVTGGGAVFPVPFKAPSLCTAGYTACPLAGAGFECLDTQSNLESCGGCVSALAEGEDCSAAHGVSVTSCVKGQCIIDSCAKGFRLVDGACKSVVRSVTKK